MVAQPKYEQFAEPLPLATPAAPRPRLADDADVGGQNPALAAQRSQLEAFLADEEPSVVRYSGAKRLAIILGGSAVLWAALAVGVARLTAIL